MISNTIKVFTLIVTGIILGYFALEILFRLFPSSIPKDLESSFYQIRDPDLLRKFKVTDNIAHNSDGKNYRLKTVPLIFKDIAYRDDGLNGSEAYAVAIGDSFTMGPRVELEAVWTELLEKQLNKDVVNMGVSGYSAIPELITLDKYGKQLKPKVVMFSFYYNDFLEDYNFNKRLKEEKFTSIREFLEENSIVYNTVRLLITKLSNLSKDNNSLSDLALNSGNLNLTFYAKAAIDDAENIKLGKNFTENAILNAKKLCDSIGAKFILVIFPTKEHVYSKFIKTLDKSVDLSLLGSSREAILNLCKSNNLDCVDLYQDFVKYADDGQQMYFNRDIHLNEVGNKLVADVIFGHLKNS